MYCIDVSTYYHHTMYCMMLVHTIINTIQCIVLMIVHAMYCMYYHPEEGNNNSLRSFLQREIISEVVTGYRRGRGFKCGFYYPSLARYCQYGPESYSHV